MPVADAPAARSATTDRGSREEGKPSWLQAANQRISTATRTVADRPRRAPRGNRDGRGIVRPSGGPMISPARAVARTTGWLDRLQDPLLLAIRLYWGWSLMWNGWGKFH